ncbi:MAG: hypothetical protein DMF76_21545 [Acidobacteria bacterium]|nr:MAG: hypothetical protein DMF76_21545 [Acidobacteriota bacterium]
MLVFPYVSSLPTAPFRGTIASNFNRMNHGYPEPRTHQNNSKVRARTNHGAASWYAGILPAIAENAGRMPAYRLPRGFYRKGLINGNA